MLRTHRGRIDRGWWGGLREREQLMLIGAGVLAVISLLIFVVGFRSEEQAKVSGVSWYREIHVLRYQTVEEEDWSVPDGGREKGAYRAIHHYDRVWVGSHTEHYRCGTTNNPRTCSRSIDDYESQPVYRTKYVYDIDRWKYDRSLIRKGDTSEPAWANTDDLRYSEGDVRLGDERLGAMIESYSVYVPDSFQMGYAEWQRYRPGDRVRVTRNILRHVTAVAHDSASDR